MNDPHAACFADRAFYRTVEIVENVQLARDTYRVRFESPEIARRVMPGQFLMLRASGCNDPLLGRPLALYDTVLDGAGRPVGVDVVYLVMGKFTTLLSQSRAGRKLDVWGPLGNGFAPSPAEHLVMVAGGIGQTPFLALAREYLGQRTYGDPPRGAPAARQVTLCYGARNREYLAGLSDFEALDVQVQLSTDDGSTGHHGRVTELVSNLLPELTARDRIVCCGPEPMLRAAAQLVASSVVPCQVSLETPMACGIGVCFSCVAKVRDAGGDWDYRRTCVEGPVFDAAAIEFA
ncbi:MAG TPA: dihydroorotate dehydrogenase electron transfer subunit [Pirellulales bacterium]|jgi:dihydroorotate dehydrogenase electron transfer subunit